MTTWEGGEILLKTEIWVYQYAYMAAAVFWFAIWLLLLLMWPRQRWAMIWTGLLLGQAGPVSEFWFLQDYWRPEYVMEFSLGSWRFGLEDWLATLALAGICAGVFERVAIARGFPPLPAIKVSTVARLLGLCLAGLFLMWVFATLLGWGSIYSLLIAITAVAIGMLVGHARVARLAIALALIAGAVYWAFYALLFVPFFPGVLEALWNLEKTSGLRVLGVPVEEFVWVSATMLFVGPLLRVCSRPCGVAMKRTGWEDGGDCNQPSRK